MIRISIVGATGYTGGELIRILTGHPQAKIMHCTSESYPGQPVSVFHRHLMGQCDLVTKKCDVGVIARDSDLVFLCLPHGNSAKMGKRFLKQGVRVVDLSADFRLKSAALYRRWYGSKHPCPELLKEAVYGLPEIYRQRISEARLVANPGCYSTASILSLLALTKNRIVKKDSIMIDAKSGISGAGRKLDPQYLFCQANENFSAYAVGQHRHIPEISQELKSPVTFVPHLLPINRGLLVTAYADLAKSISSRSLRDRVAEFYKNEPFVIVLPEGSFPGVQDVRNSNFCHIGVRVAEGNRKVIVVGAIDNLGKGASGQAVQNMNLMFGINERMGL